jgi:hypothetical protein
VLNSCRSPSLSALGQRVPVPASRLPHLRPPRASKGTGAETTKQKIISARSARPAPPRPARPRSQKGIVGLPPEPSGAEARVALQLRPEHSGPSTAAPAPLRPACGLRSGRPRGEAPASGCVSAKSGSPVPGTERGRLEAVAVSLPIASPAFGFTGPGGQGCDLSSWPLGSPGLEEKDCVAARCFAFALRLLCASFAYGFLPSEQSF